MAEPKAQTIQQRFGFVDTDLKSANHDQIMAWLDNNAKELFREITRWKDEWDQEDVIELENLAKAAVKEIHKIDDWNIGLPPQKPALKVYTKWEVAISSNKFIIGFIDMLISTSKYILECGAYKTHRDWAPYAIETKDKYPKFVVVETDRPIYICFEVKTSIPSLGELIRQIRMYQEYEHSRFYVVAPDDKFADQLRDQGIGFIKYPEGKIWRPGKAE